MSCIKIKSNGLECVSSSEDGTVIIWDLERFVRLQMVMANTLFECVSYHPEEYQILTSGTDRKVAYWETYRQLKNSRNHRAHPYGRNV